MVKILDKNIIISQVFDKNYNKIETIIQVEMLADKVETEDNNIDHHEEQYDNGLILCEKYIPTEVLAEIFKKTHHETLLSCQLVCKRWYNLIQNFTWHKKAEFVSNRKLSEDQPWQIYYYICAGQPFYRNLIKNCKNWCITNYSFEAVSADRLIDDIPKLLNPPLSKDRVLRFDGLSDNCPNDKPIDLVKEGFSEYVLDNLQPVIKVSEWICRNVSCPAIYLCKIRLRGKRNVLLRSYKFRKGIDESDGDSEQWHNFTNEISDYGPGLRKIQFTHRGHYQRNCANHPHIIKMAGASVELRIPDLSDVEDD